MIFVIGGRSVAFAEQTSNLTFSAACKGSGTADDKVEWEITSDAAESNFDSTRGIHYGTGTKAVSYLMLTTSGVTGSIKKIVVNASGASGTSAKLDVTVGGTAFGSQASLTKTATDYTFSGNASGEIVVKLSQTSATIALYVKSISVTYSTGSTTTATLTGISVTGTAADLWTGDDFTHEGIIVTATYDDNSEKNVTNSCTYSGYDMSKIGSQTVTVSYDGKEATYDVNVKTIGNTKETAYTVSKAVELIDAGNGLKTPVYVKGKVSEITTAWTESNGYLSFWVSEDGTENKFEMCKNYKGADNEVYTSEDECPKVGDDVICYGTLTKYITTDNTTYEFSAGNYLVEKTTVADNRTPTTVTFGEDVDGQTFSVNLGGTFESKTATVSPAGAGNVTYSSDNKDVASVDENGAITLGGIAGTATITAFFAATDDYKASSAKYYINVIDPNGPVFYESFNDNEGLGGNDGKWSGFSATSTLQYDKSRWNVENGSGASRCVKIGTGDAKGSATTPAIDLSGDKYILTFKAGAWNAKDEKTAIDVVISDGKLTYNGTTSKTQTIEMNKAKWTDYTMTIAGATNSTTITFTAKVKSDNRFFLDEVKIVKPVTSTLSLVAEDNGIYYATFSSSEAVIFPSSDVEVDAVSVKGSTLNIAELAKDDYLVKATNAEGFDVVSNGYYVPANTGVLIQSLENSVTYYYPYEAATVNLPTNQLKAAPAKGGEFTPEPGDHLYYKLAYNDYSAKKDLGFYWGAENGGAFSVKAGTAYLAVPYTSEHTNVKGFSFDGASTGVSAVDAEEPAKTRGIYNIAGQKVNAMTKAGLYIVNGKKIVIRK